MQTSVEPRALVIHDPTTRVEVARAGGWSILVVPRNSHRYQRDAAGGRLRLQLVHGGTGFSLLGPCLASRWRFDLWDGEQVHSLCCWGAVQRALADRAPMPCVPWVKEHETFWVHLAQWGPRRLMLRRDPGPD